MRTVESNDPDLVRLECQFVTWLAYHALRYEDPQVTDDALTRTAKLIPRAKNVLTINDANLLSLLNASIQLGIRHAAASGEIANLYDDLIPALKAVRGNDEVTPILPEYAVRLAEAGRDVDAERVIGDYLRATDGKTIGSVDAVRLNQAVNQLAQWGVSHAEPYDRLLAFRDSGHVASTSPGADDAVLVADFEKMQGTWTMKAGAMTHEMTINGDQGDVKFIDPDGKIAGRGNAKFTLTRSGAAKLMTRYVIGTDPTQGDAVIYRIDGDNLIHAEGMLTGVQNSSTPRLRVWKRVMD